MSAAEPEARGAVAPAQPPERSHQLIAGDWVDARSGATFTRHSPIDGLPVSRYPDSDVTDVERAVTAARVAFDEGTWRLRHARERRDVLQRAAALLTERAEEVSRWLTLEVGKPLAVSRDEVRSASETLDYFGHLATEITGEAISTQTPDVLGLVLREPVGVVGMITPWNYPLVLLAIKVGPALAAGCTAVIKPSALAPRSALLLADCLAQAGVPDGTVNVVTGEREGGAVVGEALVASSAVDKISFTGSTRVGKQILRVAAETIKRVTVELGGKSANIVFPDADLDAAVTGALHGAYLNSGQVCQAGTRLLLHERIADDFMQRLLERARGLVVGNPLDEATTVGPLVSRAQYDRVLEYLELGRASSRVELGGGPSEDPALAGGLYVQPTVFSSADPRSRLSREEIFGPVLTVLRFGDLDEAVRIANDTVYGLAGAVWTQDLATAIACARGIRAGTVWVNCYDRSGLVQMPIGGFKQSGIGRERGRLGLAEYLETKSVHLKSLAGPWR